MAAAPPHDRHEPLLRVRRLSRASHSPDDTTALLRDVSFDLWPRTITVVAGPPGNARTVLLACLTGRLAPDEGDIHLLGEPLGRWALAREHAIAVMHRRGMLLTHLTLAENITLVQQAAGLPDAPPALDVLAGVGLADRFSDRPSDLTADEAVVAALASALATAPAVLIADDPTADLAPDNPVPDLLGAVSERGIAVLVTGNDPALTSRAHQRFVLTAGTWT